MRSHKGLVALLAALLLTLPALLPLLQPGFFESDDGSFHVYRIAGLARAWHHGVLHPRLFPEFGFGYGQAVLNFYSPLAYWPGAVLTVLGFGPSAAAQLVIALGFLLAALSAYAFGAYLWGPVAGLLASVAYTYFPYHLADAYVRGALPEHFAFIWLPLILWAFTAAFRRRSPAAPLLWGSLAWAGLVFTHNLTALLMVPATILYILILAGWTRRWRRLALSAGALALALGLTATYWLPVLLESSSVGIGLGAGDGYRRHLTPLAQLVLDRLLYAYRLDPGGVADHPLSWTTALLVVVVMALSIWRLVRHQPISKGPILSFGLALTIASAFMITGFSLPIWTLLEAVLGHLQYPWRFLILTSLGVLLLAGSLSMLMPARGRYAILAAVAALLMIVPLTNLQVEPLMMPAAEAWTPDRMWREDQEAGQVGATWTAEFLPLTVQEQRWALGRAPAQPVEQALNAEPASSPPNVRMEGLGYDWYELSTRSETGQQLRLHQFHLPAWKARIDGQQVPTYPSGDLGLVTLDLPAGQHLVQLAFGPTRAWDIGGGLSVLSAVLWAALALWVWRQGHGNSGTLLAGGVILLVAAVLGLNGLGVGQRSQTPHPVGATVEDVAVLVAATAMPTLGVDDAADVTLYWLAQKQPAENYKSFVHLLSSDGSVIAQHDGDPGSGFTPTTRWQPGELVPDRHTLLLPADLAPGEYSLAAGLYQLEPPGCTPGTCTLRNLAVDPPAPDGRIDVGTLQVAP